MLSDALHSLDEALSFLRFFAFLLEKSSCCESLNARGTNFLTCHMGIHPCESLSEATQRTGRMLLWHSHGVLARFASYLFQCRKLFEGRQSLALLRKLDVDRVLLGRELVLEVELLRFHQGVLELFLLTYAFGYTVPMHAINRGR